MTDGGKRHLKRLGMVGLIACACLAGYVRQWPTQSEAPTSLEGGLLKPIAMVEVSSPRVADWTSEREDRSARPLFGMETEPVVGRLASKWGAVEIEIDREFKALADCRVQKACPEPAQDLLKIIAQGGGRTGRARVGLINRAVDLAITPTSDEAQWGSEDHWSSPFETLTTHRGDCEDYAIVKYVALRQAGLSSADVKIVVVRNLFPNEYHAVAAARVEGEWLILDNRWLTLVRDTDMVRAIPQFLLDEDGVHRFVPSYSSVPGPSASRPMLKPQLFQPT